MKKVFTLILSLALIGVSFMAEAQGGFLNRLPKRSMEGFHSRAMFADSAVVTPASQNKIRPVLNLASYSYPSKTLLTGIGAAYQHLTWNEETQKWDNEWSVGAYAWYNAALPNQTNTSDRPVAVGIAATFFKGLFLIGGNYNGKQWSINSGIGINLNN